jgi:hypothetical protein
MTSAINKLNESQQSFRVEMTSAFNDLDESVKQSATQSEMSARSAKFDADNTGNYSYSELTITLTLLLTEDQQVEDTIENLLTYRIFHTLFCHSLVSKERKGSKLVVAGIGSR